MLFTPTALCKFIIQELTRSIFKDKDKKIPGRGETKIHYNIIPGKILKCDFI
jgi:hypothetical protein